MGFCCSETENSSLSPIDMISGDITKIPASSAGVKTHDSIPASSDEAEVKTHHFFIKHNKDKIHQIDYRTQ